MAAKFRALLRPSLLRPLLLPKTLTSSSFQNPKSIPSLSPSLSPLKPSLFSPKNPFFFASIPFSSSSSESNILPIDSEEGFNAALTKAQDKKLPAIFYFTAAWCGPCRMLFPVIEEMSKKFPHVTTYKIDIDQEGLGSILNKMQISAVPTLHFFQDGKKASEMVGVDITQLKGTMEKLYKKE